MGFENNRKKERLNWQSWMVKFQIFKTLLLFLQFHALCVLHKCDYDLSKAVGSLVPSGGPVLCRDEMEEWSAGTV